MPTLVPNPSRAKYQPRKITGKVVMILLLVAAVAAYEYRGTIEDFYHAKLSSLVVAPCSQPLTYRVDSVDSRFGISEDRFKQALVDAEMVWEKAAGRDLQVRY